MQLAVLLRGKKPGNAPPFPRFGGESDGSSLPRTVAPDPPRVVLMDIFRRAPDPSGESAWLEATGSLRERLVLCLKCPDADREERNVVCALLEAFSRGEVRLIEEGGARALYTWIGTDSPAWQGLRTFLGKDR